ncbi:hypothetical protein TNCV_3530241 [Trichonephila clavipes]|uniref:Uncharacterized protein n=1 Tax=Trichonephila clavipes TaxID=2585209 RepID=A0A8X6RD04_TRICX|nr:hypothetical protein TNCV_3530241 [Trichonephila clavipes]
MNIGNPVKHQIYDITVPGKKIMQERDQRRLTRIIKRDRRQPFFQLLQILMLSHQQVSLCEPSNETLSIGAFGAKGQLAYPC